MDEEDGVEIEIDDVEDRDERDLDDEIDKMEEMEEIVARDLGEETTVARGVSVDPIVAKEVKEDGSVLSVPSINKGTDVFRLSPLIKTESGYFTYTNEIPIFILLD